MATIKSHITVGLELECVKLSQSAEVLKTANRFNHRLDHSIHADDGTSLPRQWPGAGTEIITPPMAAVISMGSDGRNFKLDAKSVLPVIKGLCVSAGHVNKSCGVHVHLGKPSKDEVFKSSWEPERVRTMLIIGKILEPVLMSHVPLSRRQNSQCAKISERYVPSDFAQFYPTGPVEAVKYSNPKRYCWLNLIETVRQGTRDEPGHGSSRATGTIEVRLLGETANAEYVQAWTLMWLKIAAYVAYVPSAMAISHICYSDALVPDLSALQSAYKNYSKVTAPGMNTPSVVRPVEEYEDPFANNSPSDSDIGITSTPITPRLNTRRPGRITSRRSTDPSPFSADSISDNTRRRVAEALAAIPPDGPGRPGRSGVSGITGSAGSTTVTGLTQISGSSGVSGSYDYGTYTSGTVAAIPPPAGSWHQQDVEHERPEPPQGTGQVVAAIASVAAPYTLSNDPQYHSIDLNDGTRVEFSHIREVILDTMANYAISNQTSNA